MTTPEFTENNQPRETFIKITEDFLMDGSIDDVDVTKMSDKELGEYAQQNFQRNLENYFETSGLAEKIASCKDDEEALNLIANESEGVHGWMDMLPNLIKEEAEAGMNCTMASAMLHMGLEKLNLPKVRTVTVKNHHIVLRELEDGSFMLYDANSKSTVDGKLVGYSRTFTPEQISGHEEIEERNGRKGFKFTITADEKDESGGFHIPDEEGKFNQKFYAYDPSIKMDIAIAIGNLSEVKNDAYELGGVEDLPLVNRNDYLRAAVQFIQRNNVGELSDDDIEAIGQENPGATDAFMKQAEKFARNGGEVPNPFDFIKSDLIKPKENMDAPPLPNKFTEEAKERREQALTLVAKHPELKNLNFGEVEEQFDLFSGNEYV